MSKSWATSANSRATMLANRGRDTKPELQVRRLIHAKGLRYGVNMSVPGMGRRTMDIAFPRRRVAVFIDGCFWHGCPEHYSRPKANAGFWSEKRTANRLRDTETTEHLVASGWTVLRFWSHEAPALVADAIEEVVRGHPGPTLSVLKQ